MEGEPGTSYPDGPGVDPAVCKAMSIDMTDIFCTGDIMRLAGAG
jgi:hypothetical protein